MNDTPFASLSALRRAFDAGLRAMLDGGGLGPFILVCANGSLDPAVHAATAEGLERLYRELDAGFRRDLESGRDIPAVEEDLLVFLKLRAVGLDRLRPTERRRAGEWEVQFNHLRAFRPKRITARVPEGIRAPFDEGAFHFNKPFMQKEAFWRGVLAGREATLYYNKYPFADFHTLLVPERERRLPQFHTAEHHAWLWELAGELGAALKGIGIGYNAFGAFASVNHLHFQLFLKPGGFPVAADRWRHNGGGEDYPAACAAFGERDEAWRCIRGLHEREVPYNLLYQPGRLYVFPRRKQGTYSQPAWTSGFTWHELAGGMIAFNRQDYEALNGDSIQEALRNASVDGEATSPL